MEMETLEVENNVETQDNSQTSFLESTIGKVLNTSLDVVIRAVMPDILEDGVIDIKNSLIEGGLQEGISTAINNAIDLGKSALGIFTGNFENISQAEKAITKGGIIDGISNLLDTIVQKGVEKNIVTGTLANFITIGKDALLDNVSKNIEQEFTNQIKLIEELGEHKEKWQEYFENQDFEGMEEEYAIIESKLEDLFPTENILNEVRSLENLHNLIKNNGMDFNISDEEKELANILTE